MFFYETTDNPILNMSLSHISTETHSFSGSVIREYWVNAPSITHSALDKGDTLSLPP